MVYVCSELDALDNCVAWVEQQGLVVPPLSIEDAGTLMSAVALLWVAAFVCRVIFGMIINR